MKITVEINGQSKPAEVIAPMKGPNTSVPVTHPKAAVSATTVPTGWDYNYGWPWWSSGSGWGWPVTVQEPFTGAWQRNQDLVGGSLFVFPALYRCITLICQDISKMRIRLVEKDSDGIWSEVDRSSPFWPVLIKPNHYQNRIQFFDEWMSSKLIHGNTYVLKGRDQRRIVTSLYILHPRRVKPLVAPDGSLYYEIQADDLAGINEDQVRVPASEIIHDRYTPLHGHSLCGLPPLFAAALSGMLGIKIANESSRFFENAARPGGVITAPERIPDEVAKRIKESWEAGYSGQNRGRTAVLGDGLKFEPIRETATDAQLIEQLKLTSEHVCTAFGVPPYMIGVGDPPNYNNIEALNQQYYSQCLQILIETIELLLDEGLGLTTASTDLLLGTEFDLSDLLRMDTSTKSKTWGDLIKNSIAAPNEARAAFDLKPKPGGESPMAQQQNYSLEALAKRDAKDDPFATGSSAAPPSDPAAEEEEPPAPPEEDEDVRAAAIAERITRAAQYIRLVGI